MKNLISAEQNTLFFLSYLENATILQNSEIVQFVKKRWREMDGYAATISPLAGG